MKTSSKYRVLMVDDDESLVGITSIGLGQLGYHVSTSTDSVEGYTMASENHYDIIILDVTMPGLTGFEVCKNLRAKGVLTPILILSGRAEKPAIIQGLEVGADDYLTKPFSQVELTARLKALIRRNKRAFSPKRMEVAGVVLDVTNGNVRHGDKDIKLTTKEALLLQRLMNEAPDPIDRKLLFQDVWGVDERHASNRLDVYIRRLRSKLKRIGADELIYTVRGSGYRFGKPSE